MSWILFLQLVLLLLLTGLLVQTVVEHIISHRWEEDKKLYDHTIAMRRQYGPDLADKGE